MIARISSSLATGLTFAIGAAMAAGIWMQPAPAPSATADRSGAATPQVDRLDLATLAAVTAARPLFDSSRKPMPATATPGQPEAIAVPEERISLAGILGDGAEQIALLRSSKDPELRRMAVGDTMSDWRIVEIGRGSVTMHGQTGEVQILPIGR
ncbi:MAG: hypothetical protein AAF390_01225 [Pseudomonadota bacterium]